MTTRVRFSLGAQLEIPFLSMFCILVPSHRLEILVLMKPGPASVGGSARYSALGRAATIVSATARGFLGASGCIT